MTRAGLKGVTTFIQETRLKLGLYITFGGIIGHMQGSRAECALARSVRKLIVLYFNDFRQRIVDAMNNCHRILFRYAL